MITLDDLIREFSSRNFRHVEDRERSPGPITEDYSEAVVAACLRLKELSSGYGGQEAVAATACFSSRAANAIIHSECSDIMKTGVLKGTEWLDE